MKGGEMSIAPESAMVLSVCQRTPGLNHHGAGKCGPSFMKVNDATMLFHEWRPNDTRLGFQGTDPLLLTQKKGRSQMRPIALTKVKRNRRALMLAVSAKEWDFTFMIPRQKKFIP